MRSSAGLLLYRRRDGELEVLLAHMGGPYWASKDEHAWSIPKGEYEPHEDPLQAAIREFTEELGHDPPSGQPLNLGPVKQPNGKVVRVWALEGEVDISEIHSNTFPLKWPPGSSQISEFPEVDRAEWFDLNAAARKLVKGQIPFLELLRQHAAS
jgi:predicted NUDIX family NTP pyrophosphohydrolase